MHQDAKNNVENQRDRHEEHHEHRRKAPRTEAINQLVDAAFSLRLRFCARLGVLVPWWLTFRVHADSTPNFNSQVAPILQKNCLACHSSAAKMGGLVMESYDALMKGGAHGAVIVPGKADQSRMILMLEGKVQPRMPFGADPLPAADIATLKAWVESGALGPAPGEASKALAPLPIPDINRKLPWSPPWPR